MTNKLKLLFIVLVIITAQNVSAQVDFVGLIALQDSTFIPYKLELAQSDGVVTGYSYTDLNGKHETKAVITGSWDEKSRILKFKETDIIYTKSDYNELDFCNINFEGKVRKIKDNQDFTGAFESFFPDGERCLTGNLLMKSEVKVKKRLEKFERKIKKSKRVNDSLVEKVLTSRIYNQYDSKGVLDGETVNLSWPSTSVQIKLWDDGVQDGDLIDLYINDRLILNDFTPSKKEKIIDITIVDQINTIKIVAVDEGKQPPNTTLISFSDDKGRLVKMNSYLTKNGSATFQFHKKLKQ